MERFIVRELTLRRAVLAAAAAGLAVPAIGAAQAPPSWTGPLEVSAGLDARPGPDTRLALDAVGGGTAGWVETIGGTQYGTVPTGYTVLTRDGTIRGALSPVREVVTGEGQVFLRQLARHRSGDVAVLLEDRDPTGPWQLYVRRGPAGVFRSFVLPPGVGGDVRAMIDTNRRIVLTWARGNTVRTAVRPRNTATWTLQPDLAAGGRVIALDVQANGRAVAVWDDDGTLTASVRRAVLVWEDDGAGTPVADLGDGRARRVLARIGVNGQAAVQWTGSVTRERLLSTRRARAATAPPPSWTPPGRIDEPGQVTAGGTPDAGLAVGPTGRVASAWTVAAGDGTSVLRVRVQLANGSVPAVTEDAGPVPGQTPQRAEVAVDARGDVAVVADPLAAVPGTPGRLFLRDAAGTWLPVQPTTNACSSAPLRLTQDVNARAIGAVCANGATNLVRIGAYVVDGITPSAPPAYELGR